MKLYSYIVKHDTGFAPNPFWGYCTLATCKPKIRSTAQIDDWIVGLSPKSHGNTVVYAMEVDEILDYASYFHDPRFVHKIPNYTIGKVVYKAGDNIYKPIPNGKFRQLQSMHSNGKEEDLKNKSHDLGCQNVLIGRTYHYFGGDGPILPSNLNELKVGRAHRNRFSQETILEFLEFVGTYPLGVLATPTIWKRGDDSWKQETK